MLNNEQTERDIVIHVLLPMYPIYDGVVARRRHCCALCLL
jgi:hypothetical protein